MRIERGMILNIDGFSSDYRWIVNNYSYSDYFIDFHDGNEFGIKYFEKHVLVLSEIFVGEI